MNGHVVGSHAILRFLTGFAPSLRAAQGRRESRRSRRAALIGPHVSTATAEECAMSVRHIARNFRETDRVSAGRRAAGRKMRREPTHAVGSHLILRFPIDLALVLRVRKINGKPAGRTTTASPDPRASAAVAEGSARSVERSARNFDETGRVSAGRYPSDSSSTCRQPVELAGHASRWSVGRPPRTCEPRKRQIIGANAPTRHPDSPLNPAPGPGPP